MSEETKDTTAEPGQKPGDRIETIDCNWTAENGVEVREYGSIADFAAACRVENVRVIREARQFLKEANKTPQVLPQGQILHPTFTYTVAFTKMTEEGVPDVYQVWRYSKTVRKLGEWQQIARWLDFLETHGTVIVRGMMYDPLMYAGNPDQVFWQLVPNSVSREAAPPPGTIFGPDGRGIIPS